MDETRLSLLFRAQTGEENAWKDLTDLYRPLIIAWLNRQGVPASDVDDLSQDVLLSVVKSLLRSNTPAAEAPFAAGCALSSATVQPITGGPSTRA